MSKQAYNTFIENELVVSDPTGTGKSILEKRLVKHIRDLSDSYNNIFFEHIEKNGTEPHIITKYSSVHKKCMGFHDFQKIYNGIKANENGITIYVENGKFARCIFNICISDKNEKILKITGKIRGTNMKPESPSITIIPEIELKN